MTVRERHTFSNLIFPQLVMCLVPIIGFGPAALSHHEIDMAKGKDCGENMDASSLFSQFKERNEAACEHDA